MPKRLNPNLAKINRNYTVQEIAALYDVHKNTVRAWLNRGLTVCSPERPALILGSELRRYLQQQRKERKRQCGLLEVYCMRCRRPSRPAGDMADYQPMTATTGRLVALCPTCSGAMNKYTNLANLAQIEKVLDVARLQV